MNKIYFLIYISLLCQVLSAQNKLSLSEALINISGNENTEKLDSLFLIDTFNYNPVVNLKDESVTYENILSEYFSLFLVFQSDNSSEDDLIKLATKKESINISSEFINKNRDVVFNYSSPEEGVLVSYLSKFDKFSRKNKLSLDVFRKKIEQDPLNNKLLELLYFPKIINRLDRLKIESMLSLKHGISLLGEENYISSSNDTLWDFKKNRRFLKHVTGIGRDDYYNLYQKQSHNSQLKGISIGLNEIKASNAFNDSEIPDQTFMIWGDNNADLTLSSSDKEGFYTMERVWKTQTTSTRPIEKTIEMKVDTTIIKNHENINKDSSTLWLSVTNIFDEKFDYKNSTNYEAALSEEGYYLFSDVPWTLEKDTYKYFTFFKAPIFFADTETIPNCSLETEFVELHLKFIGNKGPFKGELKSAENQYTIYSQEKDYSIEIMPGQYTLEISNNEGSLFTKEISVVNEPFPEITLAPSYHLNENGKATVAPLNLNQSLNTPISYSWYKDGKLISHDEEFEATQSGSYELEYSIHNQCSKRISFEVEREPNVNTSSSILHPNPVTNQEFFSINLKLPEPLKATLRIFNITGQLVKRVEIAETNHVAFSDKLYVAGTYFINIETSQDTQTFKLIVK